MKHLKSFENYNQIDEAFGDFLRSNETIFIRDNKKEFEEVKNMPKGDDKNKAFDDLMIKAKKFAKDNDLESGARQSFLNELRRKIYGGDFKGKQS
jgi:hypothetical protein